MHGSAPRTSTTRALRIVASAALAIAWLPGCAHAPPGEDGLGESEASSEAASGDVGSSGAEPVASVGHGCATAGPSADPEAVREAIATLEAASTAWDATCDRPGPHGLCIAIASASAGGDRCGERRLGRIDVNARKRAKAASAREALDAALQDTADLGTPEDPDLSEALRDARGRAMVQLADADLEAYLSVHVPTGLDFYVEEWKKDSTEPGDLEQYEAQLEKKNDSTARFVAFYEAKNERGAALIEAYADVKKSGSAAWVLEAALRTSWLSLHFSDELRSAPLPASLRTAEMRDAYCSALQDQAAGPDEIARAAASYCVQRSEEFRVATEATTACRDLLARLTAED